MTYDKVIFLKIRKIYLLLNACVHCYFIDSIWDPFLDLRAVLFSCIFLSLTQIVAPKRTQTL